LLPGTHLLDSGYVDADLLVTAQTQHQIDVIGPPFGSYSRQRLAGEGYDLQAFILDWEAEQAHCPQGHTSVNWRPGHDVSGDPVIRIRFDGATCRACPTRRACTSAKAAPRQLTVRLQAYHEALQAARQRQATADFKVQYALRAGVGSSLHVVRVIARLWGEPLGERWRKHGHFARLAPHPLSRQTVLCQGMT
jgi:transposase